MKDRERVVDALNALLADSTVFYQKLRHYHWHVTGPEFFTLHAKFEQMYDGWATTIDAVAERILMVGGTPLHTLQSMLQISRIVEDETIPAAPEMVEYMVADMQSLRGYVTDAIAAAEAVGDRGTANLLDALLDALEKDEWMLNAWSRALVAL
jgi:starvation-inducible DNA-binding protein